jgi:mannose-1-phosphate guanylyltransferase
MTAPRGLVLTAGLGTRLRPLTYVRAKAAVPVNGETLARRAVRWLASHGITDLVLNLHHHPESIAASVGDGSDLGARVRYSWEQPLLGSAGGPRHALPLLVSGGPSERGAGTRADTFLIVNGDTLTDVAVHALLARHDAAGALVTMSVIPNEHPDKYGGVLVDGDGRVTGFTRAGDPRRSYHFVGVQVAAARVFAGLPDGVAAESVNAVYPSLIAGEPGSVAAYVCDARFRDIGTPGDYLRTSVELAAIEGDRLAGGRNLRVADSARLDRSAIWDDVEIGRGAVLTECVVADGVRIPPHARYERCAIVPASFGPAGAGERIEGDLLVKALA